MLKNLLQQQVLCSTLLFLSFLNTSVIWAQHASFIDVNALDGTNGFTMNGVHTNDWLGYDVSHAGDLNNDGIDDFMLSAVFNDENNDNAGAVYVVFGVETGWPQVFDLTTLNGSNGFKLLGDGEGDHTGSMINSAGDINNDGINDIVLTAPSYASTGLVFNGATYVVFGAELFPASINLSALDGSDGFVVYGRFSGDQASSADAAGDFNADGVDDLIIGNQAHDPGVTNAGAVYLIYGKSGPFSSQFDLDDLDGNNGIVFYGESAGDIAGTEVKGVGDFNADGVDDVLISAIRKGTNGQDAGTVYLVFGHPSDWAASNQLKDLNGHNGTIINGVNANHFLGLAIDGGGDFNGDGVADILMSAQIIEASRQETYLILGNSAALLAEQDVTALIDLTVQTGTTYFLGSPYEYSTAFAGDVNGDGLDDLVIGDYQNNINNNDRPGAAYVVFGNKLITDPVITEIELTGQVGFVVLGNEFDGSVGSAVKAAGDINFDGVDDFLVGGPLLNSNGTNAGSAYVIYGNDGIYKQGFE